MSYDLITIGGGLGGAALTAAEPHRAPDVVGLGPDGRSDEATLRHFS